jgi:phospholipid/cholesterol/gamma-HCH transport system substrate-binding protein
MARLRGALRTSFLERSPRIIGAIGLALVLGGSAFALLLTGGVFADTYRVTAYFRDSAGIEPGDEVTVAGLEAGTVKGLRIEDGVVAVDLAVNSDVELTPDTRAEVIVETLLGRKSIDLVVGRGGGRLEDGATIPLDRTSTPIEITELNDISVRLMNASDAEALDSFLAELTAVTEGKATQVRDIITGLNQVTEAIDARRVELSRLVDSLRTLSTALGDKDDTLVSLIDHLDVVLANLARRQQDIELLLTATDSASHETANLVTRNRGVIDATLAALHQDLTVLQRHQLDLAATITYLEQSVQGYSSVGYSQGVPNRWFNIFVQSLGPLGVDAIVGECGAVDQLIDSMLGTDCDEPGDDDGDEPIREEPGAGGGGSGGQGGGSAGDADGDGLTDGIDDLMDSVLGGDGGAETEGVLP